METRKQKVRECPFTPLWGAEKEGSKGKAEEIRVSSFSRFPNLGNYVVI